VSEASRKSPAPNGADSSAARSAASRQAILDAARELFSLHGYAATSVTDIVARAGRSVGLPYYHFGSKKQIFITLWNDYQISQEEHARAAVAEARRSGVTRKDLFLIGAHAYLHGAWAARDILPMVHSRDTPPGFDAVIREANTRWEKHNRALLSSYDPQRVRTAAVLMGGALEAICLELSSRNEFEANRLIENALALFAGMLSSLE
jgi:AcrR family transcriptional regulator